MNELLCSSRPKLAFGTQNDFQQLGWCYFWLQCSALYLKTKTNSLITALQNDILLKCMKDYHQRKHSFLQCTFHNKTVHLATIHFEIFSHAHGCHSQFVDVQTESLSHTQPKTKRTELCNKVDLYLTVTRKMYTFLLSVREWKPPSRRWISMKGLGCSRLWSKHHCTWGIGLTEQTNVADSLFKTTTYGFSSMTTNWPSKSNQTISEVNMFVEHPLWAVTL